MWKCKGVDGMRNKKLIFLFVIVFIILNVIIFVIPSSYTGAFWVGYIFSVISFGVMFYVWYRFLKTKEKLFSKILNIPIINIAMGYFIVQMVLLFVLKFVYVTPTWLAIVISVVFLALAFIFMMIMESSENYIEERDKEVAIKVYFIKSLQVDVEMIAEKVSNEEVKKKLKVLAEKIRYSDPMSSELLKDIEEKISSKVEIMKETNETEINWIIDEVEKLLLERNKKCKILK